MRAAVFFDRDGVVNELVPDPETRLPESPLHPEDVALVPEAADALRTLRSAGFELVGVSNQPAAAKGTVTLGELQRVQDRVLELLEQAGVRLGGFYVCFHHPRGVVHGLTARCDCRKPAPGLLFTAAAELDLDLGRSWLIGDTDSDVEAGGAAGCRTILVEHPGSAHKRTSGSTPDARVAGVAAAAERIVVTRAR